MCGIAGYSRAEASSIADGRRFARALAVGIESRGRDATGFGWFNPNGEAMYWKMPGAAKRVAPLAPLDAYVKTMIVHTRFATKGKPEDHRNNHPVIADGIVLTHNGMLDNDDELFATLDAPRIGQVDSEAIAALLSHGPAVLGGSTVDLLQLIEGDAALAWLDVDEPDTLHLARLVGRPLEIGWTRKGDLVYGSTREAIRHAGRLTGTSIEDFVTIDEGTYLKVVRGNIVHDQSFTPTRRRWSYRSTYGTTSTAPTTVKRTVSDTEIDWDNLVPRRGWK